MIPCLFLLANLATVRDEPLQPEAEWPRGELDPSQRIADLQASLSWRTGVVDLGKDLATLRVPPGFRYLDPEQAKTVLEDWWGNPPGDPTLGMIFPEDRGPIDEASWGVILTYDADGYVSDEDAGEIDYGGLLRDMQAAARREKAERQGQGYPAIDVVGWAAQPRYDARSKKLYWARELRVEGDETNTLNYDVRALGREGVLSMNAVAEASQLAEVERGMEAVLLAVEFAPGQRYEDYVPGLDRVAAFGLGGLIAGKVAVKVGLFKGFLALLLGAKKLVVVVGVAALAALRRLFQAKPVPERRSEAPV